MGVETEITWGLALGPKEHPLEFLRRWSDRDLNPACFCALRLGPLDEVRAGGEDRREVMTAFVDLELVVVDERLTVTSLVDDHVLLT